MSRFCSRAQVTGTAPFIATRPGIIPLRLLWGPALDCAFRWVGKALHALSVRLGHVEPSPVVILPALEIDATGPTALPPSSWVETLTSCPSCRGVLCALEMNAADGYGSLMMASIAPRWHVAVVSRAADAGRCAVHGEARP